MLSIHTGVAAVLIIVLGLSVVFYFTTTVLILKYEHCPYQTPLSPVIKDSLPHIWRMVRLWLPDDIAAFLKAFIPDPTHKRVVTDQEPIMDILTSRALAWLISNSENTCSVDIGLQAIAGADPSLPLQPLDDCDIANVLSHRFTGCFVVIPGDRNAKLQPVSKAIVEQASLYGRALAFAISAGDSDLQARDDRLKTQPGVRKAYEW